MTDDLNTLRPEVWKALATVDFYFNDGAKGTGWPEVRAELLRLARNDADARIALDADHDWKEMYERAKKAEAELAESRETIKRLNRRVQVAEAGIAEKVKASAPGSLGSALANAAADKYMRERDMAQAELAALTKKCTCSRRSVSSPFGCRVCNPQLEIADLESKLATSEAELAALKARIAGAPVYEIPLSKPKSEDGWVRVIESVKNERSVRGKRVRLVVED